ncbi:MAG: hypothetical protein AAF298_18575 [Cyanobacteria bacterium P01_A01_bin.40]
MTVAIRDATSRDFSKIANVNVEAYRKFAPRLKAENWQKMKQSLSNVNQTARDS